MPPQDGELPAGRVFLSCFLCFTKSGKKPPRAAEGFHFVCTNLLFWCADSRFAKPRSSLKKVLIVAVRSCCFGALNRGLQNLGASCEGERIVTFCIVQKVTKKHARGLRTSGLRGTIQSSVGKDFVKLSGGTCRNRFCPQNAGVKALNRCERVTVMQTQD